MVIQEGAGKGALQKIQGAWSISGARTVLKPYRHLCKILINHICFNPAAEMRVQC
jgi:hypothetical protein